MRVSRVEWIGIAGPTAAGKTAAALAVAQALPVPVEIVSVDSAHVYRGMDIGTAKPTHDERARVPHHLIDLLDPTQSYSAAQFVADAGALMRDIRARGRLPLLVGGTMLYFKALLEGIDAMPAADPAIRAALDAEAAERGWPALHAELSRVDPVTAARVPPGDAQRIQRALEVHRATGRPLSSFHGGAMREPTAATPLVALEPASRAWLHERIAQRFGVERGAYRGVGGGQRIQAVDQRLEVQHRAAHQQRQAAARTDVAHERAGVGHELRGGVAFGGVEQVDQVVRDKRPLVARRLRGADVHAAVDERARISRMSAPASATNCAAE